MLKPQDRSILLSFKTPQSCSAFPCSLLDQKIRFFFLLLLLPLLMCAKSFKTFKKHSCSIKKEKCLHFLMRGSSLDKHFSCGEKTFRQNISHVGRLIEIRFGCLGKSEMTYLSSLDSLFLRENSPFSLPDFLKVCIFLPER